MSDIQLKRGDVIHLVFPQCHIEEERDRINKQLIGYYALFGVQLGAISWVPGVTQMAIVSVCRKDD